MKVELLTTLKASRVWKRGTVFDDTVSPIPKDILLEIEEETGAVRVLGRETATESQIVVEEPPEEESPIPEYLSELERLINRVGSVVKTAALLSISVTTIYKWRKIAAVPNAQMKAKIQEKLSRYDTDRDDSTASAAVEGTGRFTE